MVPYGSGVSSPTGCNLLALLGQNAIEQNLPYYYVSAAILCHQHCTLSYVLYSRSTAENFCHCTRIRILPQYGYTGAGITGTGTFSTTGTGTDIFFRNL